MDWTDIRKDKRAAFIMAVSLAWGIVAHGYAFFHKFSYHDDSMWYYAYEYSETYALGRWGIAIFGKLGELLFGRMNSMCSIPAMYGILTLIFIAAMLYIICLKLQIDNRLLIATISGVMICFPAITGLFGFMYTAPFYYFGTFLSAVGAYCLYRRQNVGSFILCTLLMAFSTGIYQANIPVNMMILLLFMFDEVCRSDMEWKEYFILAIKNSCVCIVFMIEYFVLNRLFLMINGLEMSDYKDAESFGMAGPLDYCYRIFTAYKRFVKPVDYITRQGVSANMFPDPIGKFHQILIIISLILIIVFIRSFKNRRKMAEAGIILAISPLFAYFVYVMVGEGEIHGLMTYAEVFMFFIPVYVLEMIGDRGRFVRGAGVAATGIILFIAFSFARYSNVCYLKADVMQSEAVSYFNRMIERIQSTEGYKSGTPVVYICGRSKNDEGFSGNRFFDPIYLPPYQGNSIINDFAWKEMMDLWCSFSPVNGDESKFYYSEEVSRMPCYPDEGSVRMIDGTIVVKFADPE